jgi:hypothetical protein
MVLPDRIELSTSLDDIKAGKYWNKIMEPA